MHKSTSSSSSRKRPRSDHKVGGSNKEDGPPREEPALPKSDKDNDDDEVHLLTPHALRLLKLIQDGTADHARIAAENLEEISRQAASPLILWDILGRLQGFLVSPLWSTRQNAQLAMEGVARNLPLPDQTAFLQDTHTLQETNETPSDNLESSSLWLKLDDVEENLTTILEQGRQLMASAESKYQAQIEEKQLEHLRKRKGEEMSDFCERRLEMQRRILSRRLGLSDFMTSYSSNVGAQFQCDLMQEGFEAMEANDDKRKSRRNRKKRKIVGEEAESQVTPHSIRSLLVREIEQLQQQHSVDLSHRKPQSLLGGELVYRMFDSSWSVRHGALMGVLALIRAWKSHQRDENQQFGTWLHDILARTICVLALDRFGDFSGTSTESYSGSMVAPVREMAGQVFSVVFHMATKDLQRKSTTILSELTRSKDWEVRHGALLALKYSLSLIYSMEIVDKKWQEEFELHATEMAFAALQDLSDDVQGVAAQVLIQRVNRNESVPERTELSFRAKVGRCVWESLEKTRLHSSSLEDLVALFTRTSLTDFESASKCMSCDGTVVDAMASVLARFGELLESEYVTVKTSIVHAIGLLGHLIPETVASWKSSSQFLDTRNVENVSSESSRLPSFFKQCFCNVVKTIYEIRKRNCEAVAKAGDNDDGEALLRECSQTWKVLSFAKNFVLCALDPFRFNLEEFLLSDFFCLTGETIQTSNKLTKTSSNRQIAMRMGTAHTLAEFWAHSCDKMENYDCRLDILCFCLAAGLESPLTCHCEASCLLIQALLKAERLDVSVKHKLDAIVGKMMEILCPGPACLSYSPFSFEKDPKNVQLILASFRGGFRIAIEGDGAEAAAKVAELWQQLVPIQKLSSVSLTVDSMRLCSVIAGTVVSLGMRLLPSKLTPIVRPLMTSLQNEADCVWQKMNCECITGLLVILWEQAPPERTEGFQTTFEKILLNLCNLAVVLNEPSCSAASLVIGSLVRKMPPERSLRSCNPVWERLSPLCRSLDAVDANAKQISLCMLQAICTGICPGATICTTLIETFIPVLVQVGCEDKHVRLRESSTRIIRKLCSCEGYLGLKRALPTLINKLKDVDKDTSRSRACSLLVDILDVVDCPSMVSPFVRDLLPVAMSLMTDSINVVAEVAARLFSRLVQIAPLVRDSDCSISGGQTASDIGRVIDHLIHGKKLPQYELPRIIAENLRNSGIFLRDYQLEGISWLRFLQEIKLNGALCDSMGLGKTASALIAIALCHLDEGIGQGDTKRSLVICPSSVVGHWMNEIRRFLPSNSAFKAVDLIGDANKRRSIFEKGLDQYNLVVTSYAVLRSEIEKLHTHDWTYVVLDEGHLLKNPKTATARASRRLRSRHRLVLSGTPVQNHVEEVWAIFDFLMPHFLGSSEQFSKEFARPISKGQNVNSSAVDVAFGMEKLKQLHQQVLPFILRREKDEVLRELPPKIVTRIPCIMSPLQQNLYRRFCCGPQGEKSLLALHSFMSSSSTMESDSTSHLGKGVLRSLLYLRLLCTHPWLVRSRRAREDPERVADIFSIEASGKLVALREILRESGLKIHDHTAADNDSSVLYCERSDDVGSSGDEYEQIFGEGSVDCDDSSNKCQDDVLGSRCLIFAQFMDSLDIVEDVVLKRHMPSTCYLRLDGRVPPSKRSEIVDTFNRDDNFKVLLLTTKIGGLGLNLTGADTVIFLEHDWNPHADLQAMDRAHRLGQKKTVHVYQLVTENSIEEKAMAIHEKKLTMSKTIVNTENSSLYSMGTERLLDIFQFRSELSAGTGTAAGFEDNLDVLVERYKDEYQSLSLSDFVKSFDGNQKAK